MAGKSTLVTVRNFDTTQLEVMINLADLGRIRPLSDAELFMSRTQFEFGLTEINNSTSVDSDVELN